MALLGELLAAVALDHSEVVDHGVGADGQAAELLACADLIQRGAICSQQPKPASSPP